MLLTRTRREGVTTAGDRRAAFAEALSRPSAPVEMFGMPIYEYVCGRCGHEFELLVRSDEIPICPSCHSRQLEKQFSAPAAHTSGPASDCPQRSSCPAEHCCGQNCGMGDWGQ